MSSWRSALLGFLLATPFLVLNFIVALRIEPAYSLLGLFPAMRNSPFLPLGLLLLFPIGAYISLRPWIENKKKGGGYMLNVLVAGLLLLLFVPIFSALASELYRCSVLLVPNCD
jgi:hypothetical protein